MKNTDEDVMYGNPYDGKTVNESKTVTDSHKLTEHEQWKINNADWIDRQIMYFGKSGKEVKEALEIVQLLEEMKREYALLMPDGNYQWYVLRNIYSSEPDEEIEVKTISFNDSLLECLRDAKSKGWKP